jgi:hypothetical protein
MPVERADSISLGMPSAKALQMATEAVRRRYVLPETMEARPAPEATAHRSAFQGDPPRFLNRPRRHVA